MRRSAAPSKLKRNGSFLTPFVKKQEAQSPVISIDNNGNVLDERPKPSKLTKYEKLDVTSQQSGARSTADILKLLSSTSNFAENKTIGRSPNSTSSAPVMVLSPKAAINPIQVETSKDNIENEGVRYFSAMWCKLSTKKHKKWEGDAVLKVMTRTAVLLDMEGKVISRGTGYKVKELLELGDVNTLVVGGKECEIQGSITKTQFDSGTCFMGLNESIVISETKKSLIEPQKPFSNPSKIVPETLSRKQAVNIQPRYSTTTPNAFILPRPNKTHQWDNNKNGLPLIDVVVDPQIAKLLRPHQREGIIFLYKCVMGMQDYQGSGAILADEMGLGKTLQCIALIWTLLKQGPYGGQPMVKNVIVITPSSLVKNWLQELKKWLGTEKVSVYAVDQKSTVENFVKSRLHSVLLISYEMYTKSADILAKKKFDLLICDEGHRLKNSNIKASNTISQLNTLRRVILTGTPIQNDLQELFAIIDFCNPGVLGSSLSFKQIFENPIIESQRPGCTEEQKELGRARADKLNSITSQFVLRRTQEIINKYIPPKTENVVFCRPTPLQIEIYLKILSSKVLSSCLSSSFRGTDHLTCISALKKLCNHPYLLNKDVESKCCNDENDFEDSDPTLYNQIESAFPENYATKFNLTEDSGKFATLGYILSELKESESKEKIVIASNYTQTLALIEELCKQNNYPFLRLDGSTPTIKRQELVNTFNNKHSPHFVFLLSTKAGGVGLNLIGASRIVLFDIDWNPATDLQAQARVWRDGQKKNVHCYRLITTGTIEEKIYQRQIDKQCLSTVVMDTKESSKIKFSVEVLKNLFSFKSGSLCTTHDTLKCDCQDPEAVDKQNASVSDSELQTSSRPYQLVPRKLKASKSRGMSELLKWRHIPAPLSFDQVQDGCLLAASEHITFLFQNGTTKDDST